MVNALCMIFTLGGISLLAQLGCMTTNIIEIVLAFTTKGTDNGTWFIILWNISFLKIIISISYLTIRIVTCCSPKYKYFAFLKIAIFLLGFVHVVSFGNSYKSNQNYPLIYYIFGTTFLSFFSLFPEMFLYQLYSPIEKKNINQQENGYQTPMVNYSKRRKNQPAAPAIPVIYN